MSDLGLTFPLRIETLEESAKVVDDTGRVRVALQLQLPILTPQPDAFVTLRRRQVWIGTRKSLLPMPLNAVDLGDPVPNGLA